MKKIIFLYVLFLSCTSANSQITKGNWLLGGNAQFSSTKFTSDLGNNSTSSIQVAGNIGYFFLNKLSGGVKPGYLFQEFNNTTSNSTHFLSFGPFVRYYFLPVERRVNLFAETSYAYGTETVNGEKGYPSHSISFLAGPSFFLNSSVALELQIGYSTLKRNDQINTNRKIFQVGIGFQYHLEKEK